MPRAQHQKEQVILRSGTFYVRFYTTTDGRRERVTKF